MLPLSEIESKISEKIIRHSPVSGGCISDSYLLTTESGLSLFVKYNHKYKGMFRCEANGLAEIKKSNTLKVPNVIAFSDNFLVLETITQGKMPNDFYRNFAKKLAMMHKYTNQHFGFYEDNFIGSNPQYNSNENNLNWTEFYFQNRIMFQYKLAEQRHKVTEELKSLISRLENKISEILNISPEAPSLLHGDLWTGNYMRDEAGVPVLIDPAVYYGNREAELAMTKLFGQFPEEFYETYNFEYPLQSGWEYRENIYKLYHIFNHYNLFGDGYYRETINLLKYYLR